MDLSLVVPTYNEKENLPLLLEKIFFELKKSKIKGEVIVVDDNSKDGTGDLVEKLKRKYKNLHVIHRAGKLGLSSAVLDGWKIAKGKILGVMDADLSHPTEKISEMFFVIKRNDTDLVIGSRYVKGGKIVGWSTYRKILSKGATLLARVFTSVKDPMAGFFMIKKECIKNVNFDSKGFKILLEMIIKAEHKEIKEIPITFVNRTKGKSKAGIKEIFYYLNNLARYLTYKKSVSKEFIKFSLVGSFGVIVNLLVLYFLTEFVGVYYLLSAILAFVLAATSNFIGNKLWTFNEHFNENLPRKYARFFLVSLFSLLINLMILYLLTEFFHVYYLVSQVLAIGCAFIFNFIGNKIWTFRA